jgi:hypothetical protein
MSDGGWRERIGMVAAVIAGYLFFGLAAKIADAVPASAGPLEAAWTVRATPSPAADIVAVGNVFWVCGAEEMIASSSDGGVTWTVHHQTPGGKTLLHIEFVNDRIAHAAGRGGVVLATVDGGQTWTAHNAGADVHAFSFGDERNGIAVIGGDAGYNRIFQPGPGHWHPLMSAPVKVTHDGGDHWEDIPALGSPELSPFTYVLSVAALDAKHYVMLRQERQVRSIYVSTEDGGKSWRVTRQGDDITNREFARLIVVHDGEFWSFGSEMLLREKHGGYSVPLVLHSKDGHRWMRGIALQEGFGTCNLHGCYLWDGTVVSAYGVHEQYWAFPQDGSLSKIWAVAGDRVCTLGAVLKCGPARVTDEPQPMRIRQGFFKPIWDDRTYLHFDEDCVACGVWLVPLDPGINWQGRVVVSFEITADGTVDDLSEDGAPAGPLGALIEEQVKRWRFSLHPQRQGRGTYRLTCDASMSRQFNRSTVAN